MANLLLVDDDLDMTEAIAEVLRDEGHDVRVAGNGREGLDRVAEKTPDVVITDVDMPVVNGPDMVRWMYRHDAGMECIPIVLTSGAVNLRAIADAVGTPYFLCKPFSADELSGKVGRALEERTAPSPKDSRR